MAYEAYLDKEKKIVLKPKMQQSIILIKHFYCKTLGCKHV